MIPLHAGHGGPEPVTVVIYVLLSISAAGFATLAVAWTNRYFRE